MKQNLSSINAKPRTILITGATDGIGLALARQYQASGARLILIGRRPLSALTDTLFTAQNYCAVDLAQADCAEKILSWLHENNISLLNLVVHNAAIGYVGALEAQSAANIQLLITINLIAPIRLTYALLPLITLAAGKLIYISSVASALPSPNYAVYSATKAALDGFVRNLQIELMATRSSVKAQVIHPGATRTALHAKSGATREQMDWERFPSAESVAAQIANRIERQQRTSTIGLSNQVIRFLGRSFPTIIDTRFFISTRKKHQQPEFRSPNPAKKPHCVITGAADGIGKALALAFSNSGYTITGLDLDQQRAKQTLAELQGHDPTADFLLGNLGSAAEVERMVAELAQRPLIDTFIHNAGINAVGPFASTPIEQQVKVIQINFTAPLLLTASLLQQGRLTPWTTLVFVSSLSHFVSYPGAAVYAASKDGLASFARSLRIVIQGKGGQVLTVYPGPTRTAHARRYSPDNRNEQRRMAPEALAQQIHWAVQQRRHTLIPGFGNRVFALLGQWFPSLMEQVMRRIIFDKLKRES